MKIKTILIALISFCFITSLSANTDKDKKKKGIGIKKVQTEVTEKTVGKKLNSNKVSAANQKKATSTVSKKNKTRTKTVTSKGKSVKSGKMSAATAKAETVKSLSSKGKKKDKK